MVTNQSFFNKIFSTLLCFIQKFSTYITNMNFVVKPHTPPPPHWLSISWQFYRFWKSRNTMKYWTACLSVYTPRPYLQKLMKLTSKKTIIWLGMSLVILVDKRSSSPPNRSLFQYFFKTLWINFTYFSRFFFFLCFFFLKTFSHSSYISLRLKCIHVFFLPIDDRVPIPLPLKASTNFFFCFFFQQNLQ